MYIVQTAQTKFFDPVLSKFRTIGIRILQPYQIRENFNSIQNFYRVYSGIDEMSSKKTEDFLTCRAENNLSKVLSKIISKKRGFFAPAHHPLS